LIFFAKPETNRIIIIPDLQLQVDCTSQVRCHATARVREGTWRFVFGMPTSFDKGQRYLKVLMHNLPIDGDCEVAWMHPGLHKRLAA